MNCLEDAKEVYEELKKSNPLFPYRCCLAAAESLAQLEYQVVHGKVLVNNYCNLNIDKELDHFWNYDPTSGLFLDITASQFNIHLYQDDYLPDIYIWEKPNLIYVPLDFRDSIFSARSLMQK